MSEPPLAVCRVPVHAVNPGQFFACCGLLELADRLWRKVEAWFESGDFLLRWAPEHSLSELLGLFKAAELGRGCGSVRQEGEVDDAGGDEGEAAEDSKAQPLQLRLGTSHRSLLLDWWADTSLKTWAGSMDARAIFRAMVQSIDPSSADPFNDLCIAFDSSAEPVAGEAASKKGQGRKREPFYFDARRGASARSLDLGFSSDALEMRMLACPAVEALCLVGLQRHRPMPTARPRVFEYFAWSQPLSIELAQVATCGLLPGMDATGFRFENAFRTDQKKHKGFQPATPLKRRQR